MAIRDVEAQPSGEEIQDAYDEIQDYWFPAQSEKDDLFIDLWERKHEVWIPDTMAEGRRRKIQPERMDSSEAFRIVKLVKSFFTAPSNIDLEWVGATSPTSSSKGEQLARAINEIINQLNQSKDAPLLAERFWMILLGRAARLLAPGDAYYWDFPDRPEGKTTDEWWEKYSEWKRNEPLPFVWLDLNPAQTFPTSFGRMDEELVNWTDLTLPELGDVFSPKELAGVADNSDYQDADNRYRLLTYANVTHLSYAIMARSEDRVTQDIRHHEHTMGQPAIRILNGEVSGIKEPGRYWVSVLEGVKEQIPQVDRRLSEAATASKFDAFPMFKGHFHDGSEASKITKYFEGDIIPLNAGGVDEKPEDLTPLFQPEYGEKTLALAQFGLGRIERITGASDSLEGAQGPSGQPAWSRNFSHDVAKSTFASLTDAIVASDVDAADCIMRAIASFGEVVRIPTHPGHGKKSPTIKISPEDMDNFRPTLKGDYTLRVPLNERADMDLMVNLIERVMQGNLPISIPMIMSKLGNIEDPFHQFEESRVWAYLLSPEVSQLYTKSLVKEIEGDLAADEGMDMDEFMKKSEKWPQEVRQAVMMEIMGPGVAPGNGNIPGVGGMTPETAGAMRAGQPMTVAPGGPAPTRLG